MEKNQSPLSYEENLALENELLKLKLKTEFGASPEFMQSGSLPPSVENEWLNYIYNYEKLHREGKKISVFELLGKPDFPEADKIPDDEIPRVLEKLEQHMLEHGIKLERLCEYPAAVIYRFITEELFLLEVLDLKINEGSISVYTYENFHPNAEYDIRYAVNGFLTTFFEKEEYHNFNIIYFNESFHSKSGEQISVYEIINLLRQVQGAYPERKLISFDIMDLAFDKEKGSARVRLIYQINDIEGTGTDAFFTFAPDEYGWSITGINIPGLLEL